VLSIRDRLNVIRQCVLRNEHFAPSTLPSRDREKLVTVGFFGHFIEPLFHPSSAQVHQTTSGTIWGAFLAFRYAGLQ
jgi:hypothetical protein